MPEPTLAQRVRAKYPGVYDDLSDQDLEAKVLAKYPGVYDDLPRTKGASKVAPQAAPTTGSAWQRFRQEVGPRINPVNIVSGLAQTIGESVAEAGRNPLSGGTPFVPFVKRMAQGLMQEGIEGGRMLREGNVAGAAGVVAGNVIPAALAPVAGRLVPRRIPAPFSPAKNPSVREAVAFGEQAGIPIDAATATGNRAVGVAQHLADRSFAGSFVEDAARRATDTAVQTTMQKLGQRAQRGPELTPQAAGEGVQTALGQRVASLDAQADVNYSVFRQIEKDPRNIKSVPLRVPTTDAAGRTKMTTVMVDMALPVDLRPVKAALRPIVKEKRLRSTTVQKQSDPGLHAMEVLLRQPDFVPASAAEAELGALKRVARGASSPAMRTSSQGLAARAVVQLAKQVKDVVRQAHDPRALLALESGRRLTAAKYAAQRLLDALPDEPVQAFQKLTRADDQTAALVTQVVKREPGVAPLLGRAVLERIFEKGFEEGTLGRTAGMFRDWQKLGPTTKAKLFKPKLVADLDKFFLLLKELQRNVNPSGTGQVVAAVEQAKRLAPVRVMEGGLALQFPWIGGGMQITAWGLAKLLHSPRGVRALTQGVQWSVKRAPSRPLAIASVMGNLERAAAEAGVPLVPMPVAPAVADDGAPER